MLVSKRFFQDLRIISFLYNEAIKILLEKKRKKHKSEMPYDKFSLKSQIYSLLQNMPAWHYGLRGVGTKQIH